MTSPSRAPSYAAVLRTRHACRTFGAALLGRLSYGMVSLSLMLAVKDTTGSFAAAGSVLAVFSLTGVLLSPVRAALVDRYGPRRALPPMAGAYALLLLALAHATWRPGTPGLVLGALAVAAGACIPPLGPVMRTLWSTLLPDRRLLQRAYGLDSVAEELLLVGGPLLVGLLVKYATPAAGVAAAAVLVLTGSLALVSSPVVPAMTAKPGVPAAPTGADGPGPAPGRARLRVSPELRRTLIAMAGLGLGLGALELLAVAYTEQIRQPGAVAWVLAALSASSAIGGLAHGAVSWRTPDRVRLTVFGVAFALLLAMAGFTPGLAVFVAVVALAGLFVAPALTTAYLLADSATASGGRTQAGAWVNTAVNAGMSGGTAMVGLLVGRVPLPLCFVVAAVPALLCAVAALGARRAVGSR